MEIKKILFDQYHPLDHWPFTRRCREHYGGWRVHLKYAWDFKWREQFYRFTFCVVHSHHPVTATFYEDGVPVATQLICCNCVKELGPREGMDGRDRFDHVGRSTAPANAKDPHEQKRG